MYAYPPALVLNADYRPVSVFPLSTLPWHKTIPAVMKGKLSVVAEYDIFLRSPSQEIRLPSVVALRNFRKEASRLVAFTRRNVFLRDRYRCQYCGEKYASEDLTFDHVVPRCRGGLTTWENIVAACEPCNCDKDAEHREPLTAPRKPTLGELARAAKDIQPVVHHESWRDFLYWETELEA